MITVLPNLEELLTKYQWTFDEEEAGEVVGASAKTEDGVCGSIFSSADGLWCADVTDPRTGISFDFSNREWKSPGEAIRACEGLMSQGAAGIKEAITERVQNGLMEMAENPDIRTNKKALEGLQKINDLIEFNKAANKCCKCQIKLGANVCKHGGKTYCPGCFGRLTGNWNPFNNK